MLKLKKNEKDEKKRLSIEDIENLRGEESKLFALVSFDPDKENTLFVHLSDRMEPEELNQLRLVPAAAAAAGVPTDTKVSIRWIPRPLSEDEIAQLEAQGKRYSRRRPTYHSFIGRPNLGLAVFDKETGELNTSQIFLVGNRRTSKNLVFRLGEDGFGSFEEIVVNK